MFKAKRNSLPSFGVRLGALLVLAASASIGLPLFGETAANIWYVDDDNYEKAEMDGKSPETAFGTIQEAIDAETTSSGDTIKVLPGTYNQGSVEEKKDDDTVLTRSRVYINKKVNIVATGSKDETHIVGKLDNGGAGGNAIRCIRVASAGNGSTLTGFTIRDSATFKVETTSASYCGGAVSVSATSGASQDFYVINCVISNAVTRRYGGAAYGGTFIGCKISNCKSYKSSAAFYLSHAVCSVVTGCDLSHGDYSTLESSSKFCNCTFYGNKDPQMKSSDYRNCLFLGQTKDETNSVGVIESNVYASKGKDYGNACPLQLVDPDAGDFRPLKNSDVLGAGETRYLTTERIVDLPPGFVLKDYCGNDIDLSGERVAAGACLFPDMRKYGLKVDLGNENYTVDGCVQGDYVIVDGEVSISRNSDAVRHYGIVVNGVTNLLDDGEYVYSPEGGIGEITGIIDPDWYVNPNSGNDDNNGFTPATAKRTLASVLSIATNAGDVVHAAAGDYGDLSMKYSDKYGIARAVISEGVTLTADEGAANTRIVGASGTGSFESGEGAMRCVMMYGNAMLEGFTLAGGRSSIAVPSSGSESSSKVYNGGGVWAHPDNGLTARVAGCVITNCQAYSGAAALGVSLFDTVVKDNRAQYSAAHSCNLYGCLFGYNVCQSVMAQNVYEVFDSTINRPSNSACPSLKLNENVTLANSVIIGDCTGGEWAAPPRNTVFCDSVSNDVVESAIDCLFTNRDALKLDGDFRPEVRTSVLCETGDAGLLPSDPVNAAILQKLRARRPIMNGAMDAGYCEFDWRPTYAQDMGNGITVERVSPNVVETQDNTVSLTDGASLEAIWANKGNRVARYTLNFRITGEGTLSVTVNGDTKTFASGAISMQFDSRLAVNEVGFAYAGDGMAEILVGDRSLGTIVSIR